MLVELMLPRLLSAASFRVGPSLVSGCTDHPWRQPAGRSAAAARARRAARLPEFFRDRLPVLIIVGAKDAISPPEEMGAMGRGDPRRRPSWSDRGGGHMAPLERPARATTAMAEFLARS